MSQESVRVALDLFEGPLDLLLHLIQEQHIDIAAIPIAKITEQYLETIQLLRELNLDLAGEYLVMAATLILIKSRMLLPPTPGEGEEGLEGEDPREELIRRLRQYQIFRNAGDFLGEQHDSRSLTLVRQPTVSEQECFTDWIIDATIVDLLRALKNALERQADQPVHIIAPYPVSVNEKMAELVKILSDQGPKLISELFSDCGSKQEAIVLFLAILELMRKYILQARQRKLFGDIRLSLLPVKA